MSYVNPYFYKYKKLEKENNDLKGIPTEEVKNETIQEENQFIDISNILTEKKQDINIEYCVYSKVAMITGVPQNISMSPEQVGKTCMKYENNIGVLKQL